MTSAQTGLFKGAIKSAVGSVSGLIVALPTSDYVLGTSGFNLTTIKGWEHLGIVALITVVVAEARFWNQWASSGESKPPTP